MVLISHDYKFIYIKNKKVAGSSVESFFGKYCCPHDVKYTYSDQIDQMITKDGIIGRRLNGKGDEWVSHMPSTKIKQKLGEKNFDIYFKFCVVRNPWDIMVSHYFYEKSQKSFEQFVQENTNINNWNIYSIEGSPICNFYIKYENLEKDICAVCKKLKIKNFDISMLPKHKTSFRKDNKPYQYYYTEYTKNYVYKKFKKEIDYFGYKF
jgi:hypothetical protein